MLCILAAVEAAHVMCLSANIGRRVSERRAIRKRILAINRVPQLASRVKRHKCIIVSKFITCRADVDVDVSTSGNRMNIQINHLEI
jgi:hypothetical protein